MAELVDAPDSKSGAFGRPGSTPGLGTFTFFSFLIPVVEFPTACSTEFSLFKLHIPFLLGEVVFFARYALNYL